MSFGVGEKESLTLRHEIIKGKAWLDETDFTLETQVIDVFSEDNLAERFRKIKALRRFEKLSLEQACFHQHI